MVINLHTYILYIHDPHPFIHTCIQAAIGKAHITIQGGANNMANSAAMTANLVVSDSSLLHTYIYTYIHTYTHTHTHTCIHTYIHTCIHTYMHEQCYSVLFVESSYIRNTCIHTYVRTRAKNQYTVHS